jgi:hypothetical protein
MPPRQRQNDDGHPNDTHHPTWIYPRAQRGLARPVARAHVTNGEGLRTRSRHDHPSPHLRARHCIANCPCTKEAKGHHCQGCHSRQRPPRQTTARTSPRSSVPDKEVGADEPPPSSLTRPRIHRPLVPSPPRPSHSCERDGNPHHTTSSPCEPEGEPLLATVQQGLRVGRIRVPQWARYRGKIYAVSAPRGAGEPGSEPDSNRDPRHCTCDGCGVCGCGCGG